MEGDLGQSEIKDLRVTAPGNENVRGLDVAMDDPGGVGDIQGVGDLNG